MFSYEDADSHEDAEMQFGHPFKPAAPLRPGRCQSYSSVG